MTLQNKVSIFGKLILLFGILLRNLAHNPTNCNLTRWSLELLPLEKHSTYVSFYDNFYFLFLSYDTVWFYPLDTIVYGLPFMVYHLFVLCLFFGSHHKEDTQTPERAKKESSSSNFEIQEKRSKTIKLLCQRVF